MTGFCVEQEMRVAGGVGWIGLLRVCLLQRDVRQLTMRGELAAWQCDVGVVGGAVRFFCGLTLACGLVATPFNSGVVRCGRRVVWWRVTEELVKCHFSAICLIDSGIVSGTLRRPSEGIGW